MQWKRLQNIRSTVDDTGNMADKARGRVRETEKLIQRAREELDKAKDAISKVVRYLRRMFTVRMSKNGENNECHLTRISKYPQQLEIQTT